MNRREDRDLIVGLMIGFCIRRVLRFSVQVEGQGAPRKTVWDLLCGVCVDGGVLSSRQEDATITDEMMYVTMSKLAESPARAERAYCSL